MYKIVMECQVCRTPARYDSELPDAGNRYEYCSKCNQPRLFDIAACVDMSDDKPQYKAAKHHICCHVIE